MDLTLPVAQLGALGHFVALQVFPQRHQQFPPQGYDADSPLTLAAVAKPPLVPTAQHAGWLIPQPPQAISMDIVRIRRLPARPAHSAR
jgi:hypothetical protein